MEKMRYGCFETNSSSMHSLIFSGDIKLSVPKELEIETTEDFGWTKEIIKEPSRKMSYWFMQLIYYLNNKYKKIKGKYYSERLDYREFSSFVRYSDSEEEIGTFYRFPWIESIKKNAINELTDRIKELEEYFLAHGCKLLFNQRPQLNKDDNSGDLFYMAGCVDQSSTYIESSDFKNFVELPMEDLFNLVFNNKCKIKIDSNY